jgi:hypothetical protein
MFSTSIAAGTLCPLEKQLKKINQIQKITGVLEKRICVMICHLLSSELLKHNV